MTKYEVKIYMFDFFDNTFVLDRMFGHNVDIFNNSVLSEVNFDFGSNIPVSPHPQFMQLSLEFQTFCKVINPPKRWGKGTFDCTYVYIKMYPVSIEMNLREADIEKNPLKVTSYKTEFLYYKDISSDYSLPYYCTEFVFEKNYKVKFVHSIGHIQFISNHKEYIQ